MWPSFSPAILHDLDLLWRQTVKPINQWVDLFIVISPRDNLSRWSASLAPVRVTNGRFAIFTRDFACLQVCLGVRAEPILISAAWNGAPIVRKDMGKSRVIREIITYNTVQLILAAKQREGSTGIPACDSKDPQTGMSVSQLEREIDQLVYRLYGLTPEEIQLVEGPR